MLRSESTPCGAPDAFSKERVGHTTVLAKPFAGPSFDTPPGSPIAPFVAREQQSGNYDTCVSCRTNRCESIFVVNGSATVDRAHSLSVHCGVS
jgi:hypothetical protein